MNKNKFVLIRHGESQWNSENRFTGWCDVDLSEKGVQESKKAGRLLKSKGFFFDFVFTSMLKRAIHTTWNILDELNQSWLPIEKSWRLNERHYGKLQGLNKTETASKYGKELVNQWRRSFSVVPPKLNKNDHRYPGNDLRYLKLNEKEIPLAESLELTINRLIPYWNYNILPHIKKGERVMIVAHGNSIRGLMKYLNKIKEEELFKLNIPTAIPIVYEFDKNFSTIKHDYLYD